MKKKVVLLAMSILAISMLTACVNQGSVLPASSYVDYSFDEYTLPADENSADEKSNEDSDEEEEPTEKKTESPTKKENKEDDKEKTTEAATKKK
ncbi:MAG: hypothetical protein UIM53_01590 [Acutalibacteraceae bacterium]|nr:hypothetical protein [Acutalibacteraceae bacterium]